MAKGSYFQHKEIKSQHSIGVLELTAIIQPHMKVFWRIISRFGWERGGGLHLAGCLIGKQDIQLLLVQAGPRFIVCREYLIFFPLMVQHCLHAWSCLRSMWPFSQYFCRIHHYYWFFHYCRFFLSMLLFNAKKCWPLILNHSCILSLKKAFTLHSDQKILCFLNCGCFILWHTTFMLSNWQNRLIYAGLLTTRYYGVKHHRCSYFVLLYK